MATSPAANPFDQFDAAGGNPFDQFDGASAAPAQKMPLEGGPITRIGQALGLFPQPGPATDQATVPELIAGNPVTRFAVGAAAPAIAADQAFANLADKLAAKLGMYPEFAKALNDVLGRQKDLEAAGRQAYGSQGADVAGTAGEILNPVGLMAGGAIGPLGGEATSTLAKLVKSAEKGAAIGGVYGVSTPVSEVGPNFWSDKVQQGGVGALTGALLGPAIDVTAMGIKGLYHLIEPWLPGGQESILRRTVGKVLGPKKAEVQAALDAYKSPVPGAPATAAEAGIGANSAELSGLQRLVTGYAPTEYDAIAQAQNAARRNALTSVAQTPEVQAAVKGQIGKEAAANYGAAYAAPANQAVKFDQVFRNPFVQKALPDALRLGQAAGLDPAKDGLQYLHYIKVSLDKQLAATGDNALGNAEKAAVMAAKKQLVGLMEKAVPQYGAARLTHAANMRVANQMDIGQYLLNKLSPALADFGADPAQRAAVYAQAWRDAPTTIERATGFGGPTTMEQVLSPDQLRVGQGVGESLAQSARNQQLGRAGQANAARLLRMSFDASKPEAPHVLEHKFVIWNYLINRLSGVSNERTLELLSQRMQDPAAFRKLLGSMPVTQRQRLTEQAYAFLQQQGLTPQALRTIVTGEGAVPAAKAAGEQ